jgi:hypothetical protein
MKHRRRINYSATQRAEIWDRWQRGELMSSVGSRSDNGYFNLSYKTGGEALHRQLSLEQSASLSRRVSACWSS